MTRWTGDALCGSSSRLADDGCSAIPWMLPYGMDAGSWLACCLLRARGGAILGLAFPQWWKVCLFGAKPMPCCGCCFEGFFLLFVLSFFVGLQ
jgi:hypothetical protein